MKLNWLGIALVAGVLAVSGCKKDTKKDDTGGGSAEAGKLDACVTESV